MLNRECGGCEVVLCDGFYARLCYVGFEVKLCGEL